MKYLNIGGVPEHFNLPWRLLWERQEPGTGVGAARWHDFPAGSGAMAEALIAGDLDVAILLTEAAVAAIANRGGFRILGLYTETPLLWGIHVPAASALSVESDIRGTRYAISRRGSGSHLMSYAHARAKAWPTERLDFVTVGSLDGAVTAFERGDASVFFWEKFMTQPLVDAGAFRRVGEYAAPWPAFVVCVADHAWREHRESIEELVHAALAEAQEFHSSGDAAQTIAARFALTLQAAQAWLGITRWSDRLHVEHDIVDGVARVLSELDLIENRPNIQWFTRDRRE